MAELDQMVTRMVFDIYGVERLYDSHMASTTYLLRCTKYRAQKMNETNLGAAAHTDKNFTSILHENQVHGLQIKTEDGQWIDVDLSPSTFLFMAGDPFMVRHFHILCNSSLDCYQSFHNFQINLRYY